MQIPVATRSKAWSCGRSLAGIVGSNPAGGVDSLSPVSVVCCQIEVSATGYPSSTRVVELWKEKKYLKALTQRWEDMKKKIIISS